jgi:hypothetical protein
VSDEQVTQDFALAEIGRLYLRLVMTENRVGELITALRQATDAIGNLNRQIEELTPKVPSHDHRWVGPDQAAPYEYCALCDLRKPLEEGLVE